MDDRSNRRDKGPWGQTARRRRRHKLPEWQRGIVVCLDDWRERQRHYYEAKTEALKARKWRQAGWPSPKQSAWGDPPPVPEQADEERPAWGRWLGGLAAALLVFAVWSALRSPGSPPADAEPPGPPTVVRIWLPAQAEHMGEVTDLLAELHDRLGLEVEWRRDPMEPLELTRAIALGSPPDVALIDIELVRRLEAMGALLPISEAYGFPVYAAQVTSDGLWVRSLYLVVPRGAANPEGGRTLVEALLARAQDKRPRPASF